VRPLALVLLLLLVIGSACQSRARPWKVKSENERRYGDTREACEILTDDDDGFEKCMRRRGWRREYPGGF
jgi:hypothetical protein